VKLTVYLSAVNWLIFTLGTCKIRRVFTMKRQPPDTSDFPDELHTEPLENIPITLQFSSNVNFVTQVSKARNFL